jgi:multiple sugar transport system ATP-binding protein
MAGVVLEGVSKSFGGTYAVRDVRLEVADGEFLVLVGPSGCGKSTILRMIAGLEEASEGSIYIGTRRVNDLAPRDRDVAMVFQSYALYPHMSVYENLAFSLSLVRTPRREIDARVREAAEILDITDLLRRRPRELSGGQRQRVALGRAIVRKPALFLLDEPLSNLDAALRAQTRAELTKLHRRLGTTFIYVTHDQVEAMTMGQRIAVLRSGVLQQVGPPLELYQRPANRFVAGFIGSPAMNFLQATIAAENGRLCLVTSSARLPLPMSEGVHALEDGRRVVVGIRPEDLHDRSLLQRDDSAAVIRGTVDVVEVLGSEVLLNVAAGNEQLTARVDPRTRARAGDDIDLSVDLDRLYVFDAGTEEILFAGAASDADPGIA